MVNIKICLNSFVIFFRLEPCFSHSPILKNKTNQFLCYQFKRMVSIEQQDYWNQRWSEKLHNIHWEKTVRESLIRNGFLPKFLLKCTPSWLFLGCFANREWLPLALLTRRQVYKEACLVLTSRLEIEGTSLSTIFFIKIWRYDNRFVSLM